MIVQSFPLESELLTPGTFDAGSTLWCFDGSSFSGKEFVPIVISPAVKVICEFCLSGCQWLGSVTFETGPKGSHLEKSAFSQTGLILIHIHPTIEVICESCFLGCTARHSTPIRKYREWRNLHFLYASKFFVISAFSNANGSNL
jgi:hypothetical protein